MLEGQNIKTNKVNSERIAQIVLDTLSTHIVQIFSKVSGISKRIDFETIPESQLNYSI